MPTKVKCMGLTISSCSTLLVQVHRDFGFSVQSASLAVGRCNVLACESMLCSVPLYLFSSVGLYYDSVYCTVYWYLIRVYISIHSAVYLTTVAIASATASSADCDLMLRLAIFSIFSFP